MLHAQMEIPVNLHGVLIMTRTITLKLVVCKRTEFYFHSFYSHSNHYSSSPFQFFLMSNFPITMQISTLKSLGYLKYLAVNVC